MKLKILRSFYDLHTNQLYGAGDVVEVSEERGKEILANPCGLAEKKTESKKKP